MDLQSLSTIAFNCVMVCCNYHMTTTAKSKQTATPSQLQERCCPLPMSPTPSVVGDGLPSVVGVPLLAPPATPLATPSLQLEVPVVSLSMNSSSFFFLVLPVGVKISISPFATSLVHVSSVYVFFTTVSPPHLNAINFGLALSPSLKQPNLIA